MGRSVQAEKLKSKQSFTKMSSVLYWYIGLPLLYKFKQFCPSQ